MKKIAKNVLSLLLAVCFLVPFIPTVNAQTAIDGWSVTYMGGVDADVSIDDTESYSGSSSMKVKVNGYGTGGIYVWLQQSVFVEAGQSYYVGAKAKLDDATRVEVCIDWGERYLYHKYGTTVDWNNYEFLYTATETKNVTLMIIVEGHANGVWFDDIKFENIATGENLIKNSSFDGEGVNENISDANRSNDAVFNTIQNSETFSEEDINRVIGGLKYIPVYPAKNIEIDGNIGEWGDYPSVEMPTLSDQYNIYLNDGPLDVKGDCRFAYDDDYFYVMVQLEDDKNYYVPGGSYWTGDSLQCAIYGMGETVGTEIGLAVNPETGVMDIHGVPESTIPALGEGTMSGTLTTYEFAFPWKAKFDEKQDQIKFNILANDNDGSGRRYCAELAPGISGAKTCAEFPTFEMMTEEQGVSTWLESRDGTSLVTDKEHIFDYYVVNSTDEKKTVTVKSDELDAAKTYEVLPHSGIRGDFRKKYAEELEASVSATFEIDSKQITSTVDFTVAKPEATDANTKEAIALLETQVADLTKKIKECDKKGITPDYEMMHRDILEHFIGYMNEDLNNRDFSRINYTSRVTTNIYNQDMANLDAYLAGTKVPLEAPMYLNSDVTFDAYSWYADMQMPDGSVEKRPAFINGYGHGLSAEWIGAIPSYGGNATQFEIGPMESMSTFPSWQVIADGTTPDFNTAIDRTVYKEGTQSARVQYNSAHGTAVYLQLLNGIQTVPGKTYVIEGWVKMNNGAGDAVILCDWDWSTQQRFNGTFDWKKIEIRFKATSTVTTLRCIVEYKTDAVWYDGFKCYATDDPEINILANGDFEEGDGILPGFSSESTYILTSIERFKQAEENNVYVDFIISPHRFPKDVINRLGIEYNGGGFIGYNINAPEARQVVEEHIRNIVPLIAEYDSLKSICLTNEPRFQTRDCGEFYYEDWWAYLREEYNNDINELNKIYGTNYTDFTEVDMNSDASQPAKNFDYWTFNSNVFTEWHNWMAGIVKELAPDIPIHTKLMVWAFDYPSTTIGDGFNAEQLVDFLDLNGCDAYNWIEASDGPMGKEMWYDYMQSLKQVPIIDSENHNVGDGFNNYNDEVTRHMAQDIYNGAFHGRSNAISWILSRNVGGQALHRPDALAQCGDALYDLNRLAYEVTSIQKEPKEIGILYTNSSVVNNQSAQQAAYQAYKAVAFNGKIARFVVESQLEKMNNYKVLIIPYMNYAEPETVAAVVDYIKNGGKVLIMNRDSLSKTRKAVANDAQMLQYIYDNSVVIDFECKRNATEAEYVDLLNETYRNILKDAGIMYAELIDVETGEAARNVEYVLGVYDGKININISNFRDKKGADAKLKLYINGNEITNLTNLRSMEKINDGIIDIMAYDVCTYQVETDNPFFDTYSHWSEEEVAELYNKDVVYGVSESRFNPNSKITRAEFLALVLRAMGLDEVTYTGEIADVDADKWYANTVQTALNAGIITKDAFRPDEAITREEMCEILISAYEKLNGEVEDFEQANFTDNKDISNFEVVSKAAMLGIVKGMDDGSFAPKGNATRAEAAAVVNRFDNLKMGEEMNE